MSNEMIKNQSTQPREISVITAEIKELTRQAQTSALMYAVEIGRRLEEAKSALPHGSWGGWLKEEVNFSQSTANNFMRLFNEYGAAQITIFGAALDSQALGNLPYTKALQLLAIPAEEREDFAEEVHADELSTRELQAAIKERNDAIKQAEEARAREIELTERAEAAEAAEAEAREKAAKAEEYKNKINEYTNELEAARKKSNDLKERLKKAITNPKLPPERLAEIEKSAADAAKKQAELEMSDKLAEAAKAKLKADEEKAAAEAEAKEARARLAEAEKRLKTADPEVTAFKLLFEEAQTTVIKLKATIKAISERDPETGKKLGAALKALSEKIVAE